MVEPEELDRLRTDSKRAIAIDVFVSPEAVDLVYHAGKPYYLLPDGPAGEKAPFEAAREDNVTRKPTCLGCQFWKDMRKATSGKTIDELGECRRHAPTMTSNVSNKDGEVILAPSKPETEL